MLNYFPNYFTKKSIVIYISSLIVVSILFYSNILKFTWLFFGLLEVISFFYFSNVLTKKWGQISEKSFKKKLFTTALIIRLSWVFISYFLFIIWTERPFEWHAGDSSAYNELAVWFNALFKEGKTEEFFNYFKNKYSDAGYVTFLGIQYVLTGDSIIVARILKALFGALTTLLVYKLSSRTFDESTGRMSGILVMLMPSLIYYTGLHLKEVEMLLLAVWFLERTDALLRNRKFSLNTLWLPVILGVSLFFFRTVLGVTALFSLFSALFLSNDGSSKVGKRLFASVWFIIAITYFVGTQYISEVTEVWAQRGSSQAQSMQWRSTREDGSNKYAKYASTAVFAPIIFIIPFPTIINVDNQENQMFMNGANFIKNIMAFFVMFALFWILKNGKWREYILLLSFLVGYLGIIAMSAFAHSERFHQPIIPIFMIFAAFGISKFTNNEKKYFLLYLGIVFFFILAWSWFKLSGKNLI